LGFTEDQSHLEISPRRMKKTPLQQAREKRRASRHTRNPLYPLAGAIRMVLERCEKPHGLPCLENIQVIRGELKPCGICEICFRDLPGLRDLLRQQEIEQRDAAARQWTEAAIEAERSITHVAKRNDSSVVNAETLMLGIRKTLEHDKKSVADLARELSAMSKREYKYHQVYGWVIQERFRPRSEALFDLLAWYKSHVTGNVVTSRRSRIFNFS